MCRYEHVKSLKLEEKKLSKEFANKKIYYFLIIKKFVNHNYIIMYLRAMTQKKIICHSMSLSGATILKFI